MLEWLKTSSGAYNLTFIVAMIGWLIGGIGLVAGFHLNKVKTVEAETKAKKSETERIEIAAKLETANAKTAELEHRLAPRLLAADQRTRFIEYLVQTPKGPVGVAHIGLLVETVNFSAEIRSLLEAAGFTISTYENPLGYVITAAPSPWFMAIIVGTGEPPAYVVPLMRAFHEIGIEAIPTDGRAIANPGEVKVYIGAK